MLSVLLLSLMMGQQMTPVPGQYVNCSLSSVELTACGQLSTNGCCAKGCIRNALGRCVTEQCTGSWDGWLRRPLTMSCYFHWFLLIFAGLITTLMSTVIILNLIFELRLYLEKRRMRRYLRFSPSNSPSSSIV
ncbi:uncharacterized protein LOC111602007 [Drosophila hydei]|uniref:Uncharacterized protein LOC111602007 n=1 Tax=Drosophila hydei TaxID=7224 RepID=A0A6J1M685_DROHY|nr:uncharacterized protein LOC111602007 [Drosophila hydei]XP_023174663.2 uncharacterized protein LOC111602007 [Drosophila hydei]XP_023174664.2 uncharacterized protein LOC111602007 [Drosophila hydei]